MAMVINPGETEGINFSWFPSHCAILLRLMLYCCLWRSLIAIRIRFIIELVSCLGFFLNIYFWNCRCPEFSLLNSKDSATVIINLEFQGDTLNSFQLPDIVNIGIGIVSKGKIIIPEDLQNEISNFDHEPNERLSITKVSIYDWFHILLRNYISQTFLM